MAQGKRIMVVEDDVALGTMYKTLLSSHGFNVKHCPDGEVALDMARAFQPDLIMLDIMMPKINGFDVLDILRNTPETAMVKVIVLTALSAPGDRKRAEDLGADDFLVKPEVESADIIRRINELLG